MRLPQVRITMRQLMGVIAAFGLGMAICPRDKPYLGLLVPVAFWLASLRRWPLIFPPVVVLFLCATCELVLGWPVPFWVYLPIAIVISGPLWPTRPILAQPKRLLALFVVNAAILALFLIPWTTRKPFLRDLYSIKPGMTLAEVHRIMAGYKVMAGYKEGTGIVMPGSTQQFSPAHSIVFRHSDTAEFNSDWGIVRFLDGKVVDIDFSPD
jgi:hypothetical protein